MRVVVLSLCLFLGSAFVPHHGRVLSTLRRSTAILSEPDVVEDVNGFSEPGVPSDPDFSEAPTEPDFEGASLAPPSEPKLYVSNLNFELTDDDLMEMFSQFGPVVEAHHVNDKRDRNRRRGFGFILFESMDDAAKAVAEMNDKEVSGRNINVTFALAKSENRPQRPDRRSRTYANDSGRRVYVGNLDYATSDDTLRMIFSEFGELEYCVHMNERDDPSRKRGFGFVTFESAEAATAAVENLDGLEVDGRGIKVSIALPRN